MVKVRRVLFITQGAKNRAVKEEAKEYESIHGAYQDAHMTMFHLPGEMEMDLYTLEGKDKKGHLFATVYGMDGKL